MTNNINIKQKVILGFGNKLIGTLYKGLSDSEVADLAERKAKETVNKVVDPDEYLKLFFVARSIVPVSYVSSSYIYTFEFLTIKGKICTFKFEKEQDEDRSSNLKCSIADLNGNDLKLYTQFGSFGFLPQSISKYLDFNGQGQTEVILEPNQIVVGKTEDGSIVLASIEPEHPWYYLPVKAALYVPFEVTP